ncbi:MAG TPA: hypothetical protein VEB40_05700 [Flavipsychrobacter sp.]|nr:hypothetical protein [Flavipsychrobacter sp.]
MKKVILALAILLTASNIYAQSAKKRAITASTDPATAAAIVETNKLESLKLNDKQDEAIYQLNLQNSKAFYSSSTPGSVDKATVERNKARQDMEYKKILTADQYATWKATQK